MLIKGLIDDISKAFKLNTKKPIFKFTVFEDNSEVLELSNAPKIRLRTKHIAIKFHHFRVRASNSNIHIENDDSTQQQANMLTKLLPTE